MEHATLPATAFKSPAISLSGVVDYNMYTAFRTQFDNAADKDLVVIELSTLGGDPEVAQMMGEDVRFASETEPQRRFVFLGKAVIYSAGVTSMSFFARPNRYLARGTRLMIHERKFSKSLVIDGPLTACIAVVRATLNEIECSIACSRLTADQLALELDGDVKRIIIAMGHRERDASVGKGAWHAREIGIERRGCEPRGRPIGPTAPR
ncbi:peptidase S14 [Bradyrhizobium erythrophlei]|uniref:Peptidase S14 n=1 Tax=Bradyrhizobium erythrophlei TaxID=1437360 RepID=A0A1H4Y597_9BRAD|nr:peptidase S14 [Bradyrhizobium erythrophlei]SED12164.1 hypothetical protein SAMN05444164_3760 [Bradyrhizobium erythrophlei]